jgi:hypothetical protein
VAKDGVVMLALANAGYLDLLLNWKASVDRLNITNYVIVPNDVKAAQQLSYLGTHLHRPRPRPHPHLPSNNNSIVVAAVV